VDCGQADLLLAVLDQRFYGEEIMSDARCSADTSAQLREAIVMAENRLEAALLDDEVCKHCVEVARSYLQEALAAPQPADIPPEMQSAIRAWLNCPADKRPSAWALGQQIERIAGLGSRLLTPEEDRLMMQALRKSATLVADCEPTKPYVCPPVPLADVDVPAIIKAAQDYLREGYGAQPQDFAQADQLGNVLRKYEALEKTSDGCFMMLWDWFEARGAIDRYDWSDGKSADDFKVMLDEHEAALMSEKPAPAQSPAVTNDQIKYMADRFLGWKLPENFNPDGGISFERLKNPHHHPEASPFYPMPVGTNLLDAEQATAMVRHMIEGMPAPPQPAQAPAPTAWRVWWVSLNTSRTELFEDLDKATAKARENGGCVIPLYAQPAQAPAVTDGHMTYNSIEAAFKEYRKTLTVMDERANFDSFSQGYVAGWNAKEATPALPQPAQDHGTLASKLHALASRMQHRVEAIEARDGEEAVTGKGIGIGYLLAKDLADALVEAALAMHALPQAPADD
jgi:hypothetical protein